MTRAPAKEQPGRGAVLSRNLDDRVITVATSNDEDGDLNRQLVYKEAPVRIRGICAAPSDPAD